MAVETKTPLRLFRSRIRLSFTWNREIGLCAPLVERGLNYSLLTTHYSLSLNPQS